MRRVTSTGEPRNDNGPTQLRIECLYPSGPAEQAGLQVGDILIGIGRTRFKDGSAHPLAEALRKAYSAKKPTLLELLVERDTERAPLKLEVPVEPLGKWFRKPTKPDAQARLGEGKSKLASRFAGYVKRNASEVQGGHASLMQHILFAGLAAQAHGSGATKLYWGTLERDLVLACSPDGSFQARPWHESLAMASNSDAVFGDVWTTAAWSCVLLAAPTKRGTGLPGILGS